MFIKQRSNLLSFPHLESRASGHIPLQHPFQNVKTISLEDQVFIQIRMGIITAMSLKCFVSGVLDKNCDCIFVLVENFFSEIFIYDGLSFSMLLEESRGCKFILDNSPVLDAYFYIVKKDQSLEEIQQKGVSFFCCLKDFIDENSLFYKHILALSDPTLEISRRNALELQLALDYCLGRGVEASLSTGVDYAEVRAMLGNPYCQFLLGVCFRSGLGRRVDSKRADYWEGLAYSNLAKELSSQELSGAISPNTLLQADD